LANLKASGHAPDGFLCEAVLREIYRGSMWMEDPVLFDEEPDNLRFPRSYLCESML
jgi:hypothetical protein